MPELGGVYVLDLPAGVDPETAAREFSQNPDVEYAQADRLRHVAFIGWRARPFSYANRGLDVPAGDDDGRALGDEPSVAGQEGDSGRDLLVAGVGAHAEGGVRVATPTSMAAGGHGWLRASASRSRWKAS